MVWKQLQIRDPRGKPQIVNVSGGLESARSLLQISQWCEHRYGVREVGQEKGMRPYDIPWVVLDSTLAKRTWDWQPTISVEAIMSQIASHADANPDWLSVSM